MSISNLQNRIATLTATVNRTKQQSVSLATAHSKIENKTVSKLHRMILDSPFSVEIYGNKTLPKFAEFVAALKPSETSLYSEYAAYQTLKRMGDALAKSKETPKEKIAKKVDVQNKNVAKK